MYKTAVVILNWNGIGFLKKFLGTVVQYSSGPDTIVCVADNGSTDGSAEWVRSEMAGVMVLELGSNLGFAGGYNKALEMIDSRYYVLLNSDIEVTQDWLDPLINYLDINVNAASCQPKILSWNNREYFEHAGAAGCFIDKYGYPFCRGRILHYTEKDLGQYDILTEIFWSSGACMAVRADAWRKAGGFDSSFFAHMEEIDLCWRFSKLGYKVAFVPRSVVYHVGGGTLPYSSPRKTYLNFRNSLFMLYKNLPDKDLSVKLFKRKVLDGIAALMFLFKLDFKSFTAVIKSHIDYYKAKQDLKIKRGVVKKLDTGTDSTVILNKSIVFEFYFRSHKTYDRIKWN